jgi:Flp pilus assembly protein TadG
VPNSKPHPSRRRPGRGRGQALVEFALVIPIFLAVLAILIYFGFMLYSKMTVINAAREGARAGVMTVDRTTVPTVVRNRVISAAAAAGLTLVASDVTPSCLQTTSTTTPPPACTWTVYNKDTNPNGAQPGDSVKVTASYLLGNPIPLRLQLLGNVMIVLPDSFTLSSTVQMVLE